MTDPAGRYRLSVKLGDRQPITGWWNSLSTAERKWVSWVGEYGRDGNRITLVDTESGTVLQIWPPDASSGRSVDEVAA